MKTIFRNLALGLVTTGISVVGATTTFAQDDVCTNVEDNQALYKKYIDNYAGKLDQIKVAIEAGKEYIQKYEGCVDAATKAPTYAEQVNYLKGALPERIATVEKLEKAARIKALKGRLDTSAKAKNVSEVYASGKEILGKEADFSDIALDVAITLATAGFEQTIAATPVDTYNADTINYAKSSIQRIESGKMSDTLGVWSYNLKNDKFTNRKDYALGSLNYIIGYISYYRDGKTDPAKKKEGLAYFYKAAQYNGFSKTDPTVYQAIGAWYLDEALRIDKERTAAIAAAGGKDTEETLAMYALSKGYADRAIDSYARAYKLAKDDKAQKKEYTDSLYKTLKELFAFRFDNNTSGVDTYVASVMSKPLPDPSTEVTPVKEEVPATTTTTTSTTNTTTPTKPTTPAVNTTNPVKPATTTPTKPVSQTTTTTGTEKTAANTKAKTVKPAPKKKGTR